MTKRRLQRRGDVVVNRVLEVTLSELGRVGLERLSVPEVAERAGVNKTSVYRRWPTKQHLVKAALQQSMEATTRPPETGALGSDLASLAASLADFITSPTGLGVVRTVMADGDSAEAKALTATMWKGPVRDLPRAALEQAIARGELKPDTDVELLLFTVAGAVMHRVFIERGRVDDAWLERLVKLLSEGAGKKRGRHHARSM
ncbi:MAG: TetR/AcrR family transcriptional regulator [Archangium sp.]|nr:TetR/AcrR family transcriptional regulator [Archangium sp.]